MSQKRDGLKIQLDTLLMMVVEKLGRDAQGWNGMKLGYVYVSMKEEYKKWDYEVNPKF